jgi:hypothetical protein
METSKYGAIDKEAATYGTMNQIIWKIYQAPHGLRNTMIFLTVTGIAEGLCIYYYLLNGWPTVIRAVIAIIIPVIYFVFFFLTVFGGMIEIDEQLIDDSYC